MTTQTTLEWIYPDQREDGQEDALFYDGGYGHALVARVTKGDRSVGIYTDGEVDIHVYALENGQIEQVDRLRSGDDLSDYGVKTDEDLAEIGTAESFSEDLPDVKGPNKSGYYFDVIHNCWFDLYTDNEHLDVVTHSLTEAIVLATKIVEDDDDPAWETFA